MPTLINFAGSTLGSEGERQIEKPELLEMIRAYRRQRYDVIAHYGNNRHDSRACYFSADVYHKIFSRGCDGIRTYYGVRTEPDGLHYHNIILVGTRGKEDALAPEDYVAIAHNPQDDDGAIYDWGSLCPPSEDCELGTLLEEADKP